MDAADVVYEGRKRMKRSIDRVAENRSNNDEVDFML